MDASAGTLPWSHRLLITALLAGVGLRVAFWLGSTGSNDIRIWAVFAREIEAGGLIQEYVRNSRFNHPPLMGLWSVAALKLSQWSGMDFSRVFKVVPLAADLAAIVVVTREVARRRLGGTLAMATAMATSLVTILVAAYHGNTDTACAFLALIAILLVDRGDRPFLAGLALAGALNVKLIPLVLLPALLVLQARSLRHAGWFILGGVIGMLPFLAPAWSVGEAFYKNAIAYNSFPNRWGLHFLFDELMQVGPWRQTFAPIDAFWSKHARYVILLGSLVLGLHARWRGLSARSTAAAAMGLFLVLAPGIGVQYFVFPAILIAAVGPGRATVYGLLAGVFAAAIYAHFSPLTLPLASFHRGPIPVNVALLGVPVWFVLLELILAHGRGRADAWLPMRATREGAHD